MAIYPLGPPIGALNAGAVGKKIVILDEYLAVGSMTGGVR